MCIIIYTPNGRIPRKHLQRSLTNNPDGWGYMWSLEGNIYIRKGLERGEFWAQWRADREWIDGQPLVFHSRIGTHGTKTVDNCHPFEVPNHNLALAHNGIISNHAKKDSELSDTRHFVNDILADMPDGFLRSKAIRRLIGDYIGWSKLAFLSGTGQVTLINSSLGTWHAQRWYSNTSFKPEVKKQWNFGYLGNTAEKATATIDLSKPQQTAFAAAMGGVTPTAPTPAQPTWINRLKEPVS
jgi:predicted glutamine amidotransferase